MTNYQRCRPCGGGRSLPNPCPEPQPQPTKPGCGCSETIVEPTVHCRIADQHHHEKVRHIVPIVYHQTHHHHKHHEYEVKRKFTQDHQHHEHGRFNGDWCETDRGHGRNCDDFNNGHGRNCDDFGNTASFDQGSNCDDQFYS
ncbi:MAG: hypothetical protein FWG67_05215 [Defluviitaleaceae bacterium]|nr:hypothetical protein [Defluviitaleaceae bacterium]